MAEIGRLHVSAVILYYLFTSISAVNLTGHVRIYVGGLNRRSGKQGYFSVYV